MLPLTENYLLMVQRLLGGTLTIPLSVVTGRLQKVVTRLDFLPSNQNLSQFSLHHRRPIYPAPALHCIILFLLLNATQDF
jgi:hypothetical protein